MIPLDDWHAAGKHFTFRGLRIFFRDEGTGPPVLLIHGFPTASWDWNRVWPTLLARGHRLIACDMLGFGFSAKPRDHDYSLVEQADLHEALAAELGLRQVLCVAHDYGVSVAQELLARQSEQSDKTGENRLQLQAVCFLNGGLFPDFHRPRLIQKLLAGPLGPLLSRVLSERSFRRSFSAVFGPHTQPSAEDLRDFWALMSREQGQRIMHKLIGYMAERRQHRQRWTGALLRSPAPLRLVDGPEDPVSGRHLAEHYQQVVPAADVVLLEGIGHYPQVEAPDATAAAIVEFFARCTPRGG